MSTEYLTQPDVTGLWLVNSSFHYGGWIPVVVYKTDEGVMMARKNDELKSETVDSWIAEKHDRWFGPVENPNESLSTAERKVFEEYKAVMNWLESNDTPPSVVFNSARNQWGRFTRSRFDDMSVNTEFKPARLRDAVLAEIRKEAK